MQLHVHIYRHRTPAEKEADEERLSTIEKQLATLISQGATMTAELKAQFDRAKADSAELKTELDSAVSLINSIPDLIRKAVTGATDETEAIAAVKELADTIEGESANIKTALAANTPSAPAAAPAA